jgi:hypothetical protein
METIRRLTPPTYGRLDAEMSAADASSLRAALLAHANAGDGWGYYPGRSSRIEPTCWALLALGGAARDFDPEPHWRFLTNCQRTSGLLVEDTALPTNVSFNALAAVALLGHSRPGADRALAILLDALVAQAGLQVPQSPNFRQDNSLRGWSWTESTFSWVEPTCWALLALKRAEGRGIMPRDGRARVDEAERMLIDRCCREGGWNYGNSNALGKDLFPYVPVTALALLALQNRRDLDAVSRSLTYLKDHWPSEASTISLALTSLCFRRFGVSTDQVDQTLAARLPIASSLDNIHAMATALCALTANDRAFTI